MLLNIDVIAEARETLGEATLRAFLARMLAEVEETGSRLLHLMAAQDFATLAATAHRVSGSAAAVGATGLHAALKDIENSARGPATPTVLPDLIARLQSRTVETRAALTDIIGPV